MCVFASKCGKYCCHPDSLDGPFWTFMKCVLNHPFVLKCKFYKNV